jgi:hypothetical protein
MLSICVFLNVWMMTDHQIVTVGFRLISCRFRSVYATALLSSSSAGATVHDEPWPLLRLLDIGPDPEIKKLNLVSLC